MLLPRAWRQVHFQIMQLQFVGDRGKRNLGQKKEIRFPIHESEYPERKTFYSNRASHSQYYRHRTLHVRTKLLPTHIISLRLLLIILVRRRHSIDDNTIHRWYSIVIFYQYIIKYVTVRSWSDATGLVIKNQWGWTRSWQTHRIRIPDPDIRSFWLSGEMLRFIKVD